MTTCTRCLFTSDFATIHDDGVCEYCNLHDTLEANAHPEELPRIIETIRRKGKGKEFDCLMGISGGLDSTLLLYCAVRKWKLRPLVIHFDNGWNTPAAESNMKQITELLGVPVIVYKPNKIEYDNLNRAFLHAGVPDADIPNDIAMTKLMYDTAHKYGIKWILNGHDFRTEGSTPAKWTYMDAKYIQSVYDYYIGFHSPLKNYPLFTFKDQLLAGIRGIRQVRPFHYITNREDMEAELKHEIDWQDYGGKHAENVYTEFIGSYVLPNKFGIDKRIVYLSAQVRSGKITKQHAKIKLSKPPSIDGEKINLDWLHYATVIPINDRSQFDRYNFKRLKPLIWVLMKMKVVPFSFWSKYAK